MIIERGFWVAFGRVLRSMGLAQSKGAGFKALRQGEVTQYTELLGDSRRHAIDAMIENARPAGANADPPALAGRRRRPRTAPGPATGALRAGWFDLDEFSRRAGLVLAAEYADEAASAVADLPPLDLASSGSSQGRKAGGRRRHAQAAEPGPGWLPAPEWFRDPSSGKITRVWVDPADQSRHYVPEPDA